MKLLLQGDNYQQMVDNQVFLDGFIIGIDNLSINVSFMCAADEIKSFLKKFPDKEVFVILNKNYQNDDLMYLEKTLLQLSEVRVAGVLFYDLAVVYLNKTLNLNLNLIWHAEHFTTNHFTYSVYNNYQVVGMVLSLDMHFSEIKQISEKIKGITMLPIFGHYPIFNSIRRLGKNYFSFFELEKSLNDLFLQVDDFKLPIIDNKKGTAIYHPYLVDGSKIIKQLDEIDYGIINGYQVEDKKLMKVIKKIFNRQSLSGVINDLSENIFYQQTTYRIKGDDL